MYWMNCGSNPKLLMSATGFEDAGRNLKNRPSYRAIAWYQASGVTSKPTIEGHFQNRPMGITLDKNMFYRARCGCGNSSSDLIDVAFGMFGRVIHLQNLVPILAFLRGKVSAENQVRPSPCSGHSCYS